MRQTWVEIDLAALDHNIKETKRVPSEEYRSWSSDGSNKRIQTDQWNRDWYIKNTAVANGNCDHTEYPRGRSSCRNGD